MFRNALFTQGFIDKQAHVYESLTEKGHLHYNTQNT
jgi:hypothetical protein